MEREVKIDKLLCVLFTLTFVIIGGIMYYLFVPDVVFVRSIDTLLPYSFHISLNLSVPIIRIMRYYIFDFLWASAFTACVLSFFEVFSKKTIYEVVSVTTITEIILEFIQLSSLIPGHFDIWDIITEVCVNAFTLFILYIFSRFKQNCAKTD